jgi:hypothetical protein
MSNRKIAIIDNNNVVSAVIAFDVTDILEQGAIAGMLSSPECFEIDYNSEASMGWKYINGVAYPPEQAGEGV